MKERFCAVGEGGLAVVITLSLYLLALVNFPVFQSAHGLLADLVGDRLLPVSPLALITVSTVFFALAGALLAEWSPATSPRLLSGLWISIYLFFWVDPVTVFSTESASLESVAAVGAGAAFLFVFFLLLDKLGPRERPLYQTSNWRSRFAHAWMITWMGFFLGLSAVLISAVSPHWMARLGLGAAALVVSALNYAIVEHMQKAEGGESMGLGTAWKWLLLAWVLLASANLVTRHVLEF